MQIMKKTDFFNRIRDIFGADNPREITKYCQTFWPEDVKHVILTADNACENTFLFDFRWDMERTYKPVHFEKDINWSLIPFGDREFLWQFNRHRFLLCLGQSYLMTENEKYAFHYARLLRDWITRAQEGENIDLGPWRTLETGLRAEIWLRSLCMVENSQFIDGDLITLVEDCIIRHADRLADHFSPHKYISNWGVLESCGLLLFSIAAGDSHPKRKGWEAAALKRLALASRIQVLGDGTQWEQSPMYHNEVYQCFRSALYYGQKAGIDMPGEVISAVQKMAYVDGIWKKPDHTQFTQGDSDSSDIRDQITAGACLLRDPVLKYLGYKRLDFENAWQFGYQACEDYLELESRMPDFLSAELPFSGNYYFRSSWQEDGNLLHFHCGDTGGGHGHGDKLHVDLVLGGEDVLTDAGRCTYVDGELRCALKEPGSHNIVLADGKKSAACEDSWTYRKLCTCMKQQYFEGRTGAFAEGSHLGYWEDGILINRRIVWIKPSIYILADYFYAAGRHKYESLFHFGRQGTLTLCGTPSAEKSFMEECPMETAAGPASGYTGSMVQFSGKKINAWLQTVSGGGKHEITVTRQSSHYNEIGKNQTLVIQNESEGNFHRITVLNGGRKENALPALVQKIPVRSVVHEKEIAPMDAEAFKIRTGEKEYVLLLCHREIMTPTDILQCENCIGYGKAVLFDRTFEKQNLISGEVLAWW